MWSFIFYFIHLPTSVFPHPLFLLFSSGEKKIRHEVFKMLATVIKNTTEKKGMEEMERAIRAADEACDKHLQVHRARDDCAGKQVKGTPVFC